MFLLLSVFHITSVAQNFTLESPAFKMNTMIPAEYTCNGQDQSPPLIWHNVPEKTQSLTLIVDDPDAVNGSWTHWVVFNIPPTINELRAGSPLPQGAVNSTNSWGGLGYRGPCPPVGVHSYHFKLYALDTQLVFGDTTTKELVENAMIGHVLGSSELVGLYENMAPKK